MLKRTLKFCLLFFLFTLVSCSTIPKPTAVQTTSVEQTPSLSPFSLERISSWELKGKVAIYDMTASKGESINLHWDQFGRRYTLTLYGPFGANSIKLQGAPGFITLEKSNGEKITAKNPEEMLKLQTGWTLPISNLYFWIRGLPVSDLPFKKNLDDKKRVTLLLQQGWRIEYLSYIQVDNFDLPSKIFLNNAALRIKIVINQWQIKTSH